MPILAYGCGLMPILAYGCGLMLILAYGCGLMPILAYGCGLNESNLPRAVWLRWNPGVRPGKQLDDMVPECDHRGPSP